LHAQPTLLGMHSWEGNPRQPAGPELATPDYGNAGQDRSIDPEAGGWRILLAIVAGILLAVPFATPGARGFFARIAQLLTPRESVTVPQGSGSLSSAEVTRLNHLNAQGQAEFLLESAVSRRSGSTEQIMNRAEKWHGKMHLDPKLNSLLTAAFDVDDLEVRAAAVEVDLAALNLSKTPQTVARLETTVGSGAQSQRVWALWELGLLGSRGVERGRVTQILENQMQDSDVEVRHWAVEGMAYLGTDEAMELLLKTMHDDSAPSVRERAACGLAESGMFTNEQRRGAVPRLLDYAEDTSLDGQTRSWTFHALRDITGQKLPDDATAWRSWYNTSAGT